MGDVSRPCKTLMVVVLPEYQRAEARFVHEAIHALAASKDGIFGRILSERVERVGTTQITTEDGTVVEQPPTEVRSTFTIPTEDIVYGRLDVLLTGIDAAAEDLLRTVMPQFFDYIGRVSEATGTVVSGDGRSWYESLYEMLEKVEMRFNEDGTVEGDYTIVVHPDTADSLQREMESWTAEQRQALDDLMQRKREQFDAGRRRRRLD